MVSENQTYSIHTSILLSTEHGDEHWLEIPAWHHANSLKFELMYGEDSDDRVSYYDHNPKNTP